MTTRALPMNSSAPPMASLVSSRATPTGTCRRSPSRWRWRRCGSAPAGGGRRTPPRTGPTPRLARSGAPRSCGSEVMFTPRVPSAATRLASATHVSTSHAGISGSRQEPVARVGLDARPCSRCRSRSPACRAQGRRPSPRSWPPRPTVFGNMTWASMPHSSSTSRRTFGSYDPTCDVLDRPVVEREVGALLLTVPADHRAGAGAAERVAVEHPRGDAVDRLDVGDAVLVLRRARAR